MTRTKAQRHEGDSVRSRPLFGVFVPWCAAIFVLGGCAIRPARIGSRVEGIAESRAAVASAQESSRATSAELARIRTLAERVAAKESVILQWESYQLRKRHAKP